MEDIENMWSKLRLSSPIEIDTNELEDVMNKGEKSLVGKLSSYHIIGKDIVRITMAKI